MEFIINYWYIIVAIIAALVVAGVAIYRYFGLPSDAQLAKVREWLLWAVTEAEKELGGGMAAQSHTVNPLISLC